MLQLSGRSSKFNTPRLGFGKEKYYSRINWTSHGDEPGERYGVEKSETIALAEGSMTNSDNESVKNIQLDSGEDENGEEVQDQNEEETQGGVQANSDEENKEEEYDPDGKEFEPDEEDEAKEIEREADAIISQPQTELPDIFDYYDE